MLRTIQSRYLLRPFTKHAMSKHRCLATVAQDLEDAYDVVIIGGGVAGATLACSLGNCGNWIYMAQTLTSYQHTQPLAHPCANTALHLWKPWT